MGWRVLPKEESPISFFCFLPFHLIFFLSQLNPIYPPHIKIKGKKKNGGKRNKIKKRNNNNCQRRNKEDSGNYITL